MNKYILVLLFCVLGLVSCGDKNKIPTNEIHYTTIDNDVLPLENLLNFGEGRIVSNSYVQDKNLCILKFDKEVTQIWEGAFYGCSNLTSISIPPSIMKIGRFAFRGCSNLTSISIPPSVSEIGRCAFSGCSSLTSISIPPSVTEIGKWAHSGCSNLTRISIPPSVTEIGYEAFRDCSSLTNVVVSNDNKVYDSREDCNAIIHTESNTLICGCKNTVIPSSVTEIGHHAFWDTCYKEDGELKGVTVANVAVSEEDFSSLEIGDDWIPKYDYLLFKKAIEVNYSAERQAMPAK